MTKNFTNYELAQEIDALCDDDFYEVMLELGKMHECGKIEDFVKWLGDCLHEIEEKETD